MLVAAFYLALTLTYANGTTTSSTYQAVEKDNITLIKNRKECERRAAEQQAAYDLSIAEGNHVITAAKVRCVVKQVPKSKKARKKKAAQDHKTKNITQ